MADETYYSLLEISETASAVEIKTAYLRLIREVHPDRLANAPAYWQRQAEEKAKEINEAYANLSNREKRRLYDAQLTAYRGSRTTTSGQTTSRPPSPPPTSSAQQRSQTSSRPQYSAGASTSSAQTPGSQQHQAASSSAPPNVPSHPTNQPSASGLNAGQRLLFALVGTFLAFGVAAMFWDSASIGDGWFPFLLAASLLFGVACLYQRQISKILFEVRVKSPKYQRWATLGLIALVLLAGKVFYHNSVTKARDLPQESTANGSQTHGRANAATPWQEAQQSQSSSQANDRSNAADSKTNNVPRFAWDVVAITPKVNGRASVPTGAQIDTDNARGRGSARTTSGEIPNSRQVGSEIDSNKMSQPQSQPKDTPESPTISLQRSGGHSELTAADQASIESACSYAKHIQGPAAYHQCVDKQVAELAQHPSIPDLSQLSLSDQASIESACSYAKHVQGPAAYHQCVDKQVAELAQHPSIPDLSQLSPSDQASIESACSYAKHIQGPAAYHQCVDKQLAELAQYPNSPDLSQLSLSDQASIESACSYAKHIQGPASYHRCLTNQLSALGIQ